jgi:hypothetical protein
VTNFDALLDLTLSILCKDHFMVLGVRKTANKIGKTQFLAYMLVDVTYVDTHTHTYTHIHID